MLLIAGRYLLQGSTVLDKLDGVSALPGISWALSTPKSGSLVKVQKTLYCIWQAADGLFQVELERNDPLILLRNVGTTRQRG